MFKSGIAPYPTQAFHYGVRHVGPSHTSPAVPGPAPSPTLMTHSVADGAPGPPRAPAPYGLISELPLPVPAGDSQVTDDKQKFKINSISATQTLGTLTVTGELISGCYK